MEHKVAKRTTTQVVEGGQNGEMPRKKTKKRGLEMTSRLTKRAVSRILIALQNKLHRLISDVTGGEHHPDDVREALDHPETKQVVQRHIAGEGIRLVDPERSNARVFKT